MLKKLRLKNFKAWKDTGEISMAPLTVFFGTNSAGKTSIPQLLLMLKQTAESSDRKTALQLGDPKSLVDLGTYRDAVHNHDLELTLDVQLEWDLAKALEVENPVTNKGYEGKAMSFDVTLENNQQDQPQVREMQYHLLEEDRQALSLQLQRQESSGRYRLSAAPIELKRQPGRPWGLPSPVRFYGFADEAIAWYQNTGFASDFVLELERMLKSVFYLGPLREQAKRLYSWSGEIPDHVGDRGGRAIDAILAAGERRFNFRPRERFKSLPELVAARLKAMGLVYDFEVRPLGEQRREYEAMVRMSAKLPWVKLPDVGFGVSQVLPVIVECFYVPKRSIVIFEHPEIHLHPKAQADLADLFVDAIHAREDSEARNCQFIIESHSEHFLRRLQLRIAEEKLKAEDAAMYFIEGKGVSASIERLEVDDYGNILNWPQHFFGDEMGDLVARTEAQARRMEGAKQL